MSTNILRPKLRPLLKARTFRRVGVIDGTAAAYVNAVKATGATVTKAQSNALQTWIHDEKAAGRWALVGRLWLPGWGSAAANAIDLVGMNTGTFSGGVTHATGYMQGNGSNGFFNTGVAPSALGMLAGDYALFALVNQAASGTSSMAIMGAYEDANKYLQLASYNATQMRVNIGNKQYLPTANRADQVGVLMMSRTGGNDYLMRRRAAGVTYLFDTSASATGAMNTNNVYVMGLNQAGATPLQQALNDSRIGAFGLGMSFTKAQAEAFSASLATLWATLFGLTLP